MTHVAMCIDHRGLQERECTIAWDSMVTRRSVSKKLHQCDPLPSHLLVRCTSAISVPRSGAVNAAAHE
jgi:hypothetical protein